MKEYIYLLYGDKTREELLLELSATKEQANELANTVEELVETIRQLRSNKH